MVCKGRSEFKVLISTELTQDQNVLKILGLECRIPILEFDGKTPIKWDRKNALLGEVKLVFFDPSLTRLI